MLGKQTSFNKLHTLEYCAISSSPHPKTTVLNSKIGRISSNIRKYRVIVLCFSTGQKYKFLESTHHNIKIFFIFIY